MLAEQSWTWKGWRYDGSAIHSIQTLDQTKIWHPKKKRCPQRFIAIRHFEIFFCCKSYLHCTKWQNLTMVINKKIPCICFLCFSKCLNVAARTAVWEQEVKAGSRWAAEVSDQWGQWNDAPCPRFFALQHPAGSAQFFQWGAGNEKRGGAAPPVTYGPSRGSETQGEKINYIITFIGFKFFQISAFYM